MKRLRPLLLVLGVAAIVGSIWLYVFLQNPPQETLDQRVRDVASQLKCPVCQGESVADSPAQISQQIRGIIRQQLQAGQSKQQIIQYFQARYGNQIVWSPPWQGFSLLAWLVPIFLMLGGSILLFLVLRSWRTQPSVETESAETELAAELATIDDAELAFYRKQLEQELANDDPTFAHHKSQASRMPRTSRISRIFHKTMEAR